MNRELKELLGSRIRGSIETQMKAMSIVETLNDGDNHFGQIEINLQDPSLPTPATNNMMLRLTDSSFHVIQFTESFIVITARLSIHSDQIVPNLVIPDNPTTDAEKLVKAFFDNQYIFVGYKGSNQALHDYQIWHRNL
jgi:hypothetical protein